MQGAYKKIINLEAYKKHVANHPIQMIAQLLIVIALIVLIVIAYTNPAIFGVDGTPILLAVLALVYLGVSLQGIQRYCEQKQCVTTSTLLMHLFNTGTGGLFGMILFVFVPPDAKFELERLTMAMNLAGEPSMTTLQQNYNEARERLENRLQEAKEVQEAKTSLEKS